MIPNIPQVQLVSIHIHRPRDKHKNKMERKRKVLNVATPGGSRLTRLNIIIRFGLHPIIIIHQFISVNV